MADLPLTIIADFPQTVSLPEGKIPYHSCTFRFSGPRCAFQAFQAGDSALSVREVTELFQQIQAAWLALGRLGIGWMGMVGEHPLPIPLPR